MSRSIAVGPQVRQATPAGKDREDCPVGVGDLRPVDLALEHEDLMSEGDRIGGSN